MQHVRLAVAIALAALVFAADIWANDENRVTISKKVGDGALVLSFPRQDASHWKIDRASLTVDEDILINGVRLNTGTYAMYPESVSDKDWHFVFNGLDSRGKQNELLRVAIRPESGAGLQSTIAIENVKDKGRSRRADLVLDWGGKRALLRIALTGQRRGKGLKSDIPNEAKAAWEIVKSSVDALAAADLELHARDFAEDFESELDDGGGTLAHLQTLGRMRDALYGAGLNFERLEIDLGVDEISFGNLAVYTSFGTLSLKYRLLKRNKQWQVRNLSIED